MKHLFGWTDPKTLYGEAPRYKHKQEPLIWRILRPFFDFLGFVFPVLLFALGVTMMLLPVEFVNLILYLFK